MPRQRRGFTCPITGKPGYPTREAAERARLYIKSHKRSRKAWAGQLETYGPCGDCGQYHHTSSRPLGLVPAVT